MNKENFKQSFIKFHDKNYKLLLLIPLILIIGSFVYMGYFYNQHGDFIYKDVSLTGGTSVTINNENINSAELKNYLSSKLEDVNIRDISDLTTGKQLAVIVETKSEGEYTRQILEEYLKYKLTDTNSSFEFTGASLSGTFFQQLLVAILVAFVLMSIVVFVQFKNFVPSLAVIFSAFADTFMTLVVMNILGIRVSSAGIVAFLMLIGYSVDTDILLTNRVLKGGKGSINFRIFESFKTGITMTLTSLFAVLAALFIVGSFSSTLFQIFLIMALGLLFDIINTWLTNVSIIKWYALSKQKKQDEKN
jgi:preprotein translocase subunit SecF